MSNPINFRELGGLKTRDGKQVRKGQVFRTGAPGYASAAEVEPFVRRGVRLICDLRSDGERHNDPVELVEAAGISYLLPNRGRDVGDPLSALLQATESRPKTEALLHDIYRNIPFDQAPTFGALFARIVEGQAPVAYHCAFGKDRTGVFTALLLHILAVPRETILSDFVRTNDCFDDMVAAFRTEARLEPVWSAPFEHWGPLMESRPEWIDTMFATVTERHGSVESYLEEALGIGPSEREELRRTLLESI